MLLKRTALLGLWGLAGAGLLTGCKSSAPPPATLPTVPVATVGRATLANDLMLTAEFLPYQDVDVMAKVAGYVKTISVDIGDHVQQGQVLAVLEAPEIQSDVARAKAGVAAAEANIVTAQAAVQRAEATAGIAKLSYQRIQDVATKDKGLVPRQELDVAQSRQMEAAAQLASAESSVQAAKEAKAGADQEYLRAQTMMGYATIRAPFAGVVTKRYASTGSMIQAGIASQTQAMPVVKLAQNNLLRLILPVPVNDVVEVKNGQAVDVNVSSLGRMLQGTVTRSADSVQDGDSDDGYRSRRAESRWFTGSGHVCGGSSASCRSSERIERAARCRGWPGHERPAGLCCPRWHRSSCDREDWPSNTQSRGNSLGTAGGRQSDCWPSYRPVRRRTSGRTGCRLREWPKYLVREAQCPDFPFATHISSWCCVSW